MNLIHVDNIPMVEAYQLIDILVNNTCVFLGLILTLLNNLINMLLHQINNLLLYIQNFELVATRVWLIQYIFLICYFQISI
jgi:hypothetical protein